MPTEERNDVDVDLDVDIDEPRLDAGSGPPPGYVDGPAGVEGGPVSLPVALSWVELDALDAADVADGTVDVRITNLTADTITALLTVVRSSGIQHSSDIVSTVVVAAGDSSQLAIELVPADADLGNVATSMNLRVDATVVVGDAVAVSDDVALGHYQTPTLYFHPVEDNGHAVYGEETLRTTFNGGLFDPSAIAPGNEVVVPEGATLAGIVVSED